VSVGEWRNGRKCGKITVSTPDGETIIGTFSCTGGHKSTNRNGEGIKYFANGTKYECEWVDGLIQGNGKFTFINGTTLNYNKIYPIAFMNTVELQNLLNTTHKSTALFMLFRRKPMRGCELIYLTDADINEMGITEHDKGILKQLIEQAKHEVIAERDLLNRLLWPEKYLNDMRQYITVEVNKITGFGSTHKVAVIISGKHYYLCTEILSCRISNCLLTQL